MGNGERVKAMEGFEDHDKEFALYMGVPWKPVEGCTERHHMARTPKVTHDFGRGFKFC